MIKLDLAWHSKEKEEVIRVLQSDIGGLSAEKVEFKRREFGYNELKERKKASPLQIFLSQRARILQLFSYPYNRRIAGTHGRFTKKEYDDWLRDVEGPELARALRD